MVINPSIVYLGTAKVTFYYDGYNNGASLKRFDDLALTEENFKKLNPCYLFYEKEIVIDSKNKKKKKK